MSYHTPIWFPPSNAVLTTGLRNILLAEEKAKLRPVSKKEQDFIQSLKLFYNNHTTISHENRTVMYHDALKKLYFTHSAEKDCKLNF
jgi:hypothetical protein